MASREIARRDDGFTLAEVVVAAAILFFVLTAMVGLVGASQKMTVTAKQRSVVTNALAEYIDRIRALDYETLALEPDGRVKASEDLAYGAYNIHFTNRVVYPDNEAGKFLTSVYVKATCTINGRTFYTTAVVHIKNPNNDTTAATIVDPNAPVVEIVSPTPAPNSVLYGKWVHPSATSARIAADVHSPEDKITDIQYRVGNVLVRDDAGASGSDAHWILTPGVSSKSVTSRWDTTQDGVRDGFQTVIVYVTDDQGRYTTEQRQFIIDNVVPGSPGVPSMTTLNAGQARVSFAAAPDPVPVSGPSSSYATRYMYDLFRQSALDGSWSSVSTGTVSAGDTYASAMLNAGPISATVPTDPFSRYRATVRAGSPRDFNWTLQSSLETPFISAPRTHTSATEQSTCTSTYKKIGNTPQSDYIVTLYVTRPTFPVAAESYKYYVKQNMAGATWAARIPLAPKVTTVGDYYKFEFTYRESADPKQLWFKIGISVTPDEPGAVASDYILTNAAGISSNAATKFIPVTVNLNPDTTWTQ